MDPSPPSGRVVVLNGASSAGKSTLATAVQAALADLGRCWVIFSWDDFVPRLPGRWLGVPGDVGDRADEGCRYRIVREEPDIEALFEVGPVGRRLLGGYHRAIAALARAGVDVIVEDVMLTEAEWDDWTEALAGLEVLWVAVRCRADVAERREVARGDRHRGLARGTAEVTHRHATYDLELDTTTRSSRALAAEVVARLV